MNMNQELIAKAKEAKNVEELLMAAKEIGMELSKEQAEEYFAQIKKLSDDELEAVVGGMCTFKPIKKKTDLLYNGGQNPNTP